MAHNHELSSEEPDQNGSGSVSIKPNSHRSNHHHHHHRTVPVATVDVHKGESIRLQVKVRIPTDDHPNYNFVGKLLGPKGNSLKWLQEHTQTKMAILGRGSMKNKEKEEQLRRENDPKFSHLNEELHVEITAAAPAPEAYRRIGTALTEVKRFLVPDYYDDIRQQQLRELGVISGNMELETASSSSSSDTGSKNHHYGVSALKLVDNPDDHNHHHHHHQHKHTDNNNNCHDLRKPNLSSSSSSTPVARSHHHLVINRSKPYHSNSSFSSYRSPPGSNHRAKIDRSFD